MRLRTPADRRGFSVLARLEDGTTAWTNGDGSEYEQAAPNTDPGCYIVSVQPRSDGLELVRSTSQNANCDGPGFDHA